MVTRTRNLVFKLAARDWVRENGGGPEAGCGVDAETDERAGASPTYDGQGSKNISNRQYETRNMKLPIPSNCGLLTKPFQTARRIPRKYSYAAVGEGYETHIFPDSRNAK